MPVAAANWTWLIPLRSIMAASKEEKNWVRESFVRCLVMVVRRG